MSRSTRHLAAAAAALIAAAGLGSAAAAQDYRPTFQPDRLKPAPAGARNEVLVLGTPHLSDFGNDFRPEVLDPLLDRLAAWEPTAIATENLSGLQCDSLRRYPTRYAESVAGYCWNPAVATAATGLDVPAANAEAERLLAAWPASPSPAQRRQLAAVFMAAGERPSALVQWLRLPSTERVAGDGLTDELVALLERSRVQRNETSLIAAALAARLGLERLWSVDDHSADSPPDTDPAEQEASAAAINRAWNNPATQQRIASLQALAASLSEPDGVMTLYRAFNTAEAQQLAFESDFGATLVEPSPEGFGRQYLGYWETRNLRMVANVRDVIGQHPGTRMLAIVGASHKGYYEAYLHQMHDVNLVSSDVVLR
ncbi:MAG TPA: DUF5694 domain-containing protein [Brevundimonas sp.]|jgi:hypothetical protein|uniref:DUF5694 domain-containing protein n=1 Tax=Brevundimonas sp. TaxID=1871086 RepID=UPI002E12E36A|nr:DUF5694 domain-containing protein [Brevundimonas sp.]